MTIYIGSNALEVFIHFLVRHPFIKLAVVEIKIELYIIVPAFWFQPSIPCPEIVINIIVVVKNTQVIDVVFGISNFLHQPEIPPATVFPKSHVT